jgi:hypothetical protein
VIAQIPYGEVQSQDLSDAGGAVKYRVEVSNRFAPLEDLDTGVEINNIWETITWNIKISAKEILRYY